MPWEGALRLLPGRTAASCHRQKVGAQDAGDISLLGTWPSQEGACALGRLFQADIRYD